MNETFLSKRRVLIRALRLRKKRQRRRKGGVGCSTTPGYVEMTSACSQMDYRKAYEETVIYLASPCAQSFGVIAVSGHRR